MSRDPSELGLRIFKSIDHYGLDISRAIFTSGHNLEPYFQALKIDLFLSHHQEDVEKAMEANIASALVYDFPIEDDKEGEGLRIAFDGDAVLFTNESEKIFQEQGLEAFSQHEKENRLIPLKEGPFAHFIKVLYSLQQECQKNDYKITTALVTSRSHPAGERVIRTLQSWNIRIDEVFFLGGIDKSDVVKAFNAHIFFDDQELHIKKCSYKVPSALVINDT